MQISLKKAISANDMPFGNYLIMTLIATIFAIQINYDYETNYLVQLTLQKWALGEVFGHMWLHANILHFLFNIAFLMAFGNAVCLKVGNAKYPIIYLILGIAAGTAHLLYDGRPALGASGAIFGILGMHLVLCFERFSKAGPWIILIWFLLNMTLGLIGYFPDAYFSHIGGFFAGIVLATILIALNLVKNDDINKELLLILQ